MGPIKFFHKYRAEISVPAAEGGGGIALAMSTTTEPKSPQRFSPGPGKQSLPEEQWQGPKDQARL